MPRYLKGLVPGFREKDEYEDPRAGGRLGRTKGEIGGLERELEDSKNNII